MPHPTLHGVTLNCNLEANVQPNNYWRASHFCDCRIRAVTLSPLKLDTEGHQPRTQTDLRLITPVYHLVAR